MTIWGWLLESSTLHDKDASDLRLTCLSVCLVIFCWPLPVQSFEVSGPIRTHGHISHSQLLTNSVHGLSQQSSLVLCSTGRMIIFFCLMSVGVMQLMTNLIYDWRFTTNQFILATCPLRPTTRIFIFQLHTCCHSPYVTSSLTRGWVCHLQLLLALTSAVVLRSKSRRTHDYILLSQIRESPNLEGEVPVFISPRNGVTQLYSQPLGSPFVASYDSQAMVEVFDPPPPPHRIAN
jgi:hypothetical protein